MVSWFVANPSQIQWDDLKWVLRYLNGSLQGGLKYIKASREGDGIEVFVDAG